MLSNARVCCVPKFLFAARHCYIRGLVSWRMAFEHAECVFEETPPTGQVCNACKGVARECWLQNRNETCHSAFSDDALIVECAG
jgi:hypothetical protein